MKRQRVDIYTGPKILGFDVSHWQGIIDWSKIDEEFEFVFIRTGDGKTEDTKFARNWRGAQDRGLRRGVYHYFRADRDGRTQALNVLRMLRQAGGFQPGVDLPPVIDIEGGARKNLPGGIFEEARSTLPIELVVEECLEFLQVLEAELNVRPIVYTGQAAHWWLSQPRPQLAAQFDMYPLWVASYTRGPGPFMPVNKVGDGFPWSEWTFWQFTSKGESDGIKGDLDTNYFRGTEEDLDAFIKGSVVKHKAEPSRPRVDHDRATLILKPFAVVEDEECCCDVMQEKLDEAVMVLDALTDVIATLRSKLVYEEQ